MVLNFLREVIELDVFVIFLLKRLRNDFVNEVFVFNKYFVVKELENLDFVCFDFNVVKIYLLVIFVVE